MGKTVKICEAFGAYARVLPDTTNYTKITAFEGSPLILVPHQGRAELNVALRENSAGRVVIIDARHHGRIACFGKPELDSATAGKCRAVMVFGYVSQIAAVEQARLPVLAFGVTPKTLPPEIGSSNIGFLDCEAGLITHDYYIVADGDGAVAVEQELYRTKFAIR